MRDEVPNLKLLLIVLLLLLVGLVKGVPHWRTSRAGNISLLDIVHLWRA